MKQGDLFDICGNFHGGVEESQEANAAVAPSKAAMRQRIVGWLERKGTGTCDEAEVALGMSHQSCSARFSELHQTNQIKPTGDKRPTRSGCNARVFQVLRKESEDKEW